MFICDICNTECILWLWAKRQLKVWVMKVNSQMAFCAALELFANHVRPVQYECYFDVCLWTDEITSSEQRKPGSNFATDKNRHIRIHPEAPRIDFYLWNPKGVIYIYIFFLLCSKTQKEITFSETAISVMLWLKWKWTCWKCFSTVWAVAQWHLFRGTIFVDQQKKKKKKKCWASGLKREETVQSKGRALSVQ